MSERPPPRGEVEFRGSDVRSVSLSYARQNKKKSNISKKEKRQTFRSLCGKAKWDPENLIHVTVEDDVAFKDSSSELCEVSSEFCCDAEVLSGHMCCRLVLKTAIATVTKKECFLCNHMIVQQRANAQTLWKAGCGGLQRAPSGVACRGLSCVPTCADHGAEKTNHFKRARARCVHRHGVRWCAIVWVIGLLTHKAGLRRAKGPSKFPMCDTLQRP